MRAWETAFVLLFGGVFFPASVPGVILYLILRRER